MLSRASRRILLLPFTIAAPLASCVAVPDGYLRSSTADAAPTDAPADATPTDAPARASDPGDATGDARAWADVSVEDASQSDADASPLAPPPGAPVARATSVPSSTTLTVTWVSRAEGVDSIDVEVEDGPAQSGLPATARNFAFTVADPFHARARVCLRAGGDLLCSAWIATTNRSATTHFDVQQEELADTTWGFDSVDAVPWQQASRAAHGFCRRLGFTGGQLDGSQGGAGYGAYCYGDGAVEDDTSAGNGSPITSGWGFDDVNAVEWARAARAGDSVCRSLGAASGQFNGHQNGTLKGLICYGPTSAWFDVAKTELVAHGTPIGDTNQVAWAYAARAATAACQRRGRAGGRFNGWESDPNIGLHCY